MKKYGIYLAYAPEQDIRNQGLGRLLAFIISGAVDNKTPLVLAYPKWYEDEIKKLCEDQHIDFSKLETVVTNGIPMLLRMKNILEKFSKKEKSSKSYNEIFVQPVKKFLGNFFIHWLGESNIFLFVLIGFIVFGIGIIILPLVICLLGILLPLMFIHRKVVNHPFFSKILHLLSSPLHFFRRNVFAHQVYDKIRVKELARLNRKINKRTDIMAWLVPTLFWPEVKDIKTKKVIVAPDIILYDFPTQYNMGLFFQTNNKIIRTIKCADHFITYSHYVKEQHLQKPFAIDTKNITVIPHGALDLSHYLLKEDSLSILKAYQRKKLKSHPYLGSYCLDNMKYIFYSSQIRPHKNFLNLIKAYKVLLREKFVNVKLVTTANLQYDPEVSSYIAKHRLQNDVLSFYNVPSKVLAALNAQAICAVNPTLFEGGFPFTFLEGYSVGTPSIMSDIPMTREQISDQELAKIMLFDPFSVDNMIEKLEWGIANHQKLFELQKPLADFMRQRTWSDVALDYIQVLEDVSNG